MVQNDFIIIWGYELMESARGVKARLSQKDIGLGVTLLGASYLIPGYSYLSYIGFALGLAAIVLLFYRRHSMSISQGRSLYAGIITFAISIIAVVIIFVFFILNLVQYFVSTGFSSSTGAIPHSVLASILNVSMYTGVGLAVSAVFSYTVMVYFYTSRGLRAGLVILSLVSLAFKFADLFLMLSNIHGITSKTLKGLAPLINGAILQPPYILLTVASTVSLGGFIIYMGLMIRRGRINPLPHLEQNMF